MSFCLHDFLSLHRFLITVPCMNVFVTFNYDVYKHHISQNVKSYPFVLVHIIKCLFTAALLLLYFLEWSQNILVSVWPFQVWKQEYGWEVITGQPHGAVPNIGKRGQRCSGSTAGTTSVGSSWSLCVWGALGYAQYCCCKLMKIHQYAIHYKLYYKKNLINNHFLTGIYLDGIKKTLEV